jgi:hypothetical protein
MSDPLVSPTDLGVYLGLGTIDVPRAAMLLEDAQNLCEVIVSPLPAAATSVIKSAATRAYTNPTGATGESTGPYNVQRPSGGVYLTKAERRTLRNLAGRSGAFSIDLLPKGVTEVQTLVVTATAGTYVLGLDGVNTVPIAWNCPLVTLQSALQAIPGIGAGNLIVTGTVGNYTLTFAGRLITVPMSLLTIDATLLTGAASVTMTVKGVFAPGQNMPWWDWSAQ